MRVTSEDQAAELGAAIEQTGYYPAVVREGVQAAVAGERVVSIF